MKKFVVLFTLISCVTQAQLSRVYFADKGANAEMLSNPYLFLSPKAIDNKEKRNVAIDLRDVPVSKSYIQNLVDLDLEVKMTSRWFNYALVDGEDVFQKVKDLPFVKRVETPNQYKVSFAEMPEASQAKNLTYGIADNQIEMVEGEYLHDLNYRGAGMTIAVIDGGFQGTNTLTGLDSLRQQNRILGTYNFVHNDTDIYKDGSHGTSVLSILAGYIDSAYAGSAIDANYWLLKSENESDENISEMDNWLAAAEFADSVGVDIITSSLGYNNFVGGVGDFAYSDMDGNTVLVTKAADMAAAKGILVVVSAGNEGNSGWQYITAPADGDSVMAVGGVDASGAYVSFSSTGPTADGRVKPDVVAVAGGTAFISPAGPTYGNGTSFSCPIISGMAACFWQQNPSLSNMELYEAIIASCSQPFTPDNAIGFGIPNFRIASWEVGVEELEIATHINVFPNPIGDEFEVESEDFVIQRNIEISILDINGKPVYEHEVEGGNSKLKIQTSLPEGMYLLNIQYGGKSHLRKIIK
ncbi:S8 family serine peptidase [Owenweeksia hongkongensis]|uniref:S8 family serine peptidase n=1 Tax=Owenweeksia hongkongensis TaxID=253245 RepID=UPI003A90A329